MLGRDFQDQIENLRRVFLRFQKYDLELNIGKCQLMPDEAKFLGKLVKPVNPDGINAVKK
jgi:hypothetical protein